MKLKAFSLILLKLILLIVNITSSRFKKRSNKVSKLELSKYKNRFHNLNYPRIIKTTDLSDWENGAATALNKLNVQCGIGALSGFQLRKVKDNKIKYDFKCLEPKDCTKTCQDQLKDIDEKVCKTLRTPINDIDSKNPKAIQFLNRHYVKCPNEFIMTGFQLMGQSPKIYYNYRCCPVKVQDCKVLDTPVSSYGDLSNATLEKQKVQVPDLNTQAIKGFKLIVDENKDKQTISYQIDYCTITG